MGFHDLPSVGAIRGDPGAIQKGLHVVSGDGGGGEAVSIAAGRGDPLDLASSFDMTGSHEPVVHAACLVSDSAGGESPSNGGARSVRCGNRSATAPRIFPKMIKSTG